MSFVAGDAPVPAAARQAAQELTGRPVPAVRDAWSLILFSVFSVATTILMWPAAPGRNRSEAANRTAQS